MSEISQQPSIAQDLIDRALVQFGYDEFRPGQAEAVETLLHRGRLLLVAPTGGGKSLIYQLPATLLEGTTIVVSPLIALMHDQVRGLTERGVSATFLASTLDPEEMRSRMRRIADGAFQLVYVAPERLAFGGFRSLLRELKCPLIAIDEAHCISEWGHDFRPEYMQIGDVLSLVPNARVLACTATATPVVRDEILVRLGLDADTPQLLRGFARPNLILRAREVETAAQARRHVDKVLFEALGGPGRGEGAAIVYAPTRKRTEKEAERVRSLGFRADAYHAGLAPDVRKRVLSEFSSGALEVVVATNAFGMGIDRGDVRAVVHLAPPSSIESYYQEVGRAGRDGAPAFGLLIASHADYALRRRLLENSVDGRAPVPRVVEHKWQMFLELLRLVQGDECRHDTILRYFGDEAETLAGCGRCDICTASQPRANLELDAAELIVRQALSAVARVRGNFGMMAAVRLLRGESDPRFARSGLDQTRTFGLLSKHPKRFVLDLLRRCVTAGFVTFSGDEHPLVALTTEGVAVMRGDSRAEMAVPAEVAPEPLDEGARKNPAATPAFALDPDAERIFNALRVHRLSLAQEQSVPPYVVASDRSLRELAMLRPKRLDELLMAHGIGQGKVERYGEQWLEVIAEEVSLTSD